MHSRAGDLSHSERYMAFLLANLPKLKTVALQEGTHAKSRVFKRDVLKATLNLLPPEGEGVYLEFGVFQGDSMRMAGGMFPARKLYGFDSFEGFPTDGRPDWDVDFSVASLPEVPENCTLIKGWFDETLPAFLERNEGLKADFVNIDCDIYSSTKTVFDNLLKHDVMRPGTIIYFDELLNYETWLWNEMLALFEFLERGDFGISWIAMCQNVFLADDALLMLENGRYPPWPKHRKQGYRMPASGVLTDEGVDYGPLHLPHYREKVRKLAKLYDKQTARFETGEIRAEQEPGLRYKLKKRLKKLLKSGKA